MSVWRYTYYVPGFSYGDWENSQIGESQVSKTCGGHLKTLDARTDVKQDPYWRPTNIWRFLKTVSRHGELAPWISTALSQAMDFYSLVSGHGFLQPCLRPWISTALSQELTIDGNPIDILNGTFGINRVRPVIHAVTSIYMENGKWHVLGSWLDVIRIRSVKGYKI